MREGVDGRETPARVASVAVVIRQRCARVIAKYWGSLERIGGVSRERGAVWRESPFTAHSRVAIMFPHADIPHDT